jgi:hypothetical protein
VSQSSSLDRVESLMIEALEDLTSMNRTAPGLRCAAALTEAASEMQAFAQTHSGIGSHTATLRRQLHGLAARLGHLSALLASAADFYSGWCAAAPAANQVEPYSSQNGYQSPGWSNAHGPALLAFRG